MIRHKQLALSSKKSAQPDAEQLAAINRYTLEPLAAEQLYVRTAYLAHNAIDRDHEVFDDALLTDFAATLPGKGLFIKHPASWDGDSAPGVGRWYDARVVEFPLEGARSALRQPSLTWPPATERARVLEASFYIPRTEKNAGLIADIDAGVAGDVSIGFRAADRTSVTDATGKQVASRLHGPGEALEGSLVWLGAQPGARIAKAANTHNEEQAMTVEQVKALQADVAAAETKVKSLDDQLTALTKAVGAEFVQDPAKLAEIVAEGKTYRAELVDDVIAAKRQLGMVGDTEDAVNRAKQFYGAMPLDMLRTERAALSKSAVRAPQLAGSDPNMTGVEVAAKHAPDSPLINPLITGAR